MKKAAVFGLLGLVFVGLVLQSATATGFSSGSVDIAKVEDRDTPGEDLIYEYKHLTASEMKQMKEEAGIRKPDKDYNEIIDGHGTGAAPPTEQTWQEMIENGRIVKDVHLKGNTPTSSADLSTSPYFPEIRSQGGQGSCAAWAMTYYAYGYLEAKDQGWDDASSGVSSQLISPAWTYNKVNGGSDGGSWMSDNGYILQDWGGPTMETMPYDDQDHTSWGGEEAFREAPLHRAKEVNFIYDSNADVNDVKNLIDADTPVTFVMDANEYSNGFGDGNDIISAQEYDSTTYNHAQTFVGYNDSISDDGETGAFHVANSWGSSWQGDGKYWLTYDAFREIRDNAYLGLTYITDNSSYTPELLSVWHFDDAPTRDASLTLGCGDPSSPSETKSPSWTTDSSHDFPTFMTLDVTEFIDKYQNVTEDFYMDIGSATGSGTISSFRVEKYEDNYTVGDASQITGQSSNVPVTTPGTTQNTLNYYPEMTTQEALDNSIYNFDTGGMADWTGVDHHYHNDQDCMQTGDIGDGHSTYLETEISGPEDIRFYWKVSSESTADQLKFFIDGVEQDSISGVVDWQEETYSLSSGNHVLRWEYTKDSSDSTNADSGWLDYVGPTGDSPNIQDNSPDSGTTGDSYTFNATVTDFDGINQVRLYYWTDVSGPHNVSMTDVGGDNYEESITIPIDATALHYNISAEDNSNVWSETGQTDIPVIDNDPPSITDHSSDSADAGSQFTFNASATDNIGVNQVRVNYWTDVSSATNTSMNSVGGDFYEHSMTVPSGATELNYNLMAEDTFNNWKETGQIQITIDDEQSPVISDESPSQAEAGETFMFNVSVTDNGAVGSVHVYYWTDVSSSNNLSMTATGGTYYERTVTIPAQATELYYNITAVDTASNWNQTGQIDIDVVDTSGPEINDESLGNGTTGDDYVFNASVTDNSGVSSVYVKYWTDVSNPTNSSMLLEGGDHYEKTVSLPANATVLNYNISAMDSSGNWNKSVEVDLPVLDNDAPTLTDLSAGDGTIGENYTFNVSALDNIAVDNVTVHYWLDSSSPENVTMEQVNDHYEYNITIPVDTTELNYNISAVDSSDNRNETGLKTVIIQDSIKPVADAGPDKTVNEDTEAVFNGSNSSDNVEITDFTWMIEEEQVQGKEVQHNFSQPGIYEVTLNVTDEAGNYDTDKCNVTVLDVTSPTAEAGPNRSVNTGAHVLFNGSQSSDNVGITDYRWTIMSEEFNGMEVHYNFTEPGLYEITLEVTDEADNSDIDTCLVNVTGDSTPPTADAGDDMTFGINQSFTLDGSGSSDNVGIVNFTWDVREEVFYGKTVTHSISEPGTYEITLNVSDQAGNYALDTVNITVEDQTSPEALAEADNTTVKTGELVHLDGSDSSDNVGIIDYSWIFGDGLSGSGMITSHSYSSAGNYTVTLTVKDAEGNKDSDILTIDVEEKEEYDEPPEADAGEDKTVFVGETFTLDGSRSSDNSQIVSYVWTIEDEEYNGEEIDHEFSSNGTYDVTLTVEDEAGNTDSDTVHITVQREDEKDSDGDGMPDVWEKRNGLDPDDPSDATNDKDDDGYSNLKEYEKGTDPTESESHPQEDESSPKNKSFGWFLYLLPIVAVLVIIIVIGLVSWKLLSGNEKEPHGEEHARSIKEQTPPPPPPPPED